MTTKLNLNQYAPVNSLSYNCIINGGFTVNQRVYASNAALSAGAYGHDRWKAGSGGGDYTFTQLAQSTTITIKTGKTLIQVIEDKNVIGGTYTLSWTGTAQARFGIDSATPSGAYAASPITITTQTAGTVMSVEFNAGTLSNVICSNSNVALPFMPKSFEEELRACQRYYWRQSQGAQYDVVGSPMGAASTTSCQITVDLPSVMRVLPVLGVSALSNFGMSDNNNGPSTTTGITLSNFSGKNCVLACGVASGLTQYRPYKLDIISASGGWIDFSAEL